MSTKSPALYGLTVMGILAACGALPAVGCRNDAFQRSKAAFERHREAVVDQAEKVFRDWLDYMQKTMPRDLHKYPKVRNAAVDWRLKTLDYDWKRPYGAVLARVAHTTLAPQFKEMRNFFDAMEAFWHKKLDFKSYLGEYKKIAHRLPAPTANLLADFDQLMLHLEGFYGAQDMSGDDRAVYLFRHWQVAFDFPREYSESVSDYLARLCKAKLREYCGKVPFETMHFAVEKPYLEWVEKRVSKFLHDHPEFPLNYVLHHFRDDVRKRLAVLKPFREKPILPRCRAGAPYVGHVFVSLDQHGVYLLGKKAVAFNGRIPWNPKRLAGFASFVARRLPQREKDVGPENMEIVVLEAARDTPAGLLPALVDPMRKQAPRYVEFGCRRSADWILRKTVVGRLQIREVPAADRVLEVGGRSVKCRYIGQSNDDRSLASKVQRVLLVDSGSYKLGTVRGRAVTGLQEVELDQMTGMSSRSPVLVAASRRSTLQSLVSVLDRLYLNCDAKVCQEAKPRVEVQVCDF